MSGVPGTLEFSLSCELLSGDAAHRTKALTKTVTIQGSDFNLRCPNSRDAAAAAASENVEAAEKNIVDSLRGARRRLDARYRCAAGVDSSGYCRASLRPWIPRRKCSWILLPGLRHTHGKGFLKS